MLAEKQTEVSKLYGNIRTKVKPFETLIGEMVVTIAAVIIADQIIQVLFLSHLTNMLLAIYIHVSTFFGAFGVLYVYRVSRHLQIIIEVDNFLKSAGIRLRQRIKILRDLIKQVDGFLSSYNDLETGPLFLRDLIKQVDGFQKSAPLRPDIGTSIITTELKEFQEQVTNISTEKGGILSLKNARICFESLFDKGNQYFSTDPHVPSQFKNSQEWDLQAQAKFQERNNYKEGRRVLIVEKVDIIYDYILNRKKFEEFVKFHKNMTVELRVAEPAKAEIMASSSRYGLKSREVGIWIDTYCAHYDRLSSASDQETRIMITLFRKNEDIYN